MSKKHRVGRQNLTEAEMIAAVELFKNAVGSSDYVLAIDFEATCCDDDSFPRHESEIIEFGCALIDMQTRSIAGTFESFVRPQVHPTLHRFCTELTTITQDQVDNAPELRKVLRSFADWLHQKVFIKGKTLTWISWGQYDFNRLHGDCTRSRLTNPLGGVKHFNFKQVEGIAARSREKGLKGAVEHYGLKWKGVHHRGVDDAANVAQLFLHLTEKWK